MKKILLIIVAVALMAVDMVSAQSRTSYFMEGSYFRTELNPALVPTRGYLALPAMSGVGLNLSTNFLSVDNFIYQNGDEYVTALHGSVSPDDFLGNIPNVSKMALDMRLNILGVGFYKNRTFWSFGFEVRGSQSMALSKDLFTVLKTLGNGTYELGNTALSADVHLDAYLGASFPVCDWASVGVKAKFLVGLMNVGAQFDSLYANVGEDSITGTLRGHWRANGVVTENARINADGSYTMPADIISTALNNVKSFGAAIDLGAEFRLIDDHLRISAAITDLGFIKWAPETHIGGELAGDFYFNGFDIESGKADADANFDNGVLGLDSYPGYTTMLNYSVNVGVEYNILNNHIAFGVLSHTKFCNTMTYSELTASVNFRATNWLTATVSHTFLGGNKPGIFGAAINIHPAAINIYLGVDFIDTHYVKVTDIDALPSGSIYIPHYASSLNAYFGFGFNFGRPKFLKYNAK
ncbi:MAG: hypothetical protein J6V59_06230 [Alistipes sp.]|nr:hypothetical protein [Alistipes sp.]